MVAFRGRYRGARSEGKACANESYVRLRHACPGWATSSIALEFLIPTIVCNDSKHSIWVAIKATGPGVPVFFDGPVDFRVATHRAHNGAHEGGDMGHDEP